MKIESEDLINFSIPKRQHFDNYFKISYQLLLLLSFFSCSTIDKIDRGNKDYALDNTNHSKLTGIYSNKNIESTWSIYEMLYDRKLFHQKLNNDSILVGLKIVNDNKLELSFFKNKSCIKTVKLKGKYENGYFLVNARFGLLSPFFPLLWGPGIYNMSIGITKNDDLVVLESHGGASIFVIVPFFAGGGESDVEFRRVE
jgi:hypothetical protein